jgi:hypothetical protein
MAMGFWGWFWLFVIVGVGWGIISSIANAAKAKEQGNAFQAVPDFHPAVIFKGAFGGSGIAIDPQRNKFAISKGTHDTRTFSFSDLVAVEVLRNGSSVSKTNRGSQVAGAAVGAVLLGPVGLLLGGLTGSKRNVEKIDRLSLKVFTNDLVNPVHEIVFFNIPGSKPDSLAVKQGSQDLDAWHGRFQTILHMGARASTAPQIEM